MGVRRDKGRAVTRYLTGMTGIPFLEWDGNTNEIMAPAPYSFHVTTGRALRLWMEQIRLDPGTFHFSIRYDKSLPSVDKAWVATTLDVMAPLLGAHYNTISDRIEGND